MLTLLLATTLGAQAGDLSFSFKGPTRYHAEAAISIPQGYRLEGINKDARFYNMGIAADMACTGQVQGKITKVRCDFEKVAMEGQGQADEQARLDQIVADYAQKLSSAAVELEFLEDGRVRMLDIEGLPKDNDYQQGFHETARQLMRRLFTPFEMMSPKDGADPGRAWKHKGRPLVMELITNFGTTGGSVYKWSVEGKVGDTIKVVGDGRGNVSTNVDMDAGASSILNIIAVSTHRFDPATGGLAYGEASLSGEYVSSAVAGARGSQGYSFAAWMGRMNADGSLEIAEGAKPAKE